MYAISIVSKVLDIFILPWLTFDDVFAILLSETSSINKYTILASIQIIIHFIIYLNITANKYLNVAIF